MKYVLVDNTDCINITVDLASGVGISGATTYFKGIKRLKGKSFDKLWRVMTKSDYDRNYVANLRPPSSKHIEWWEEDKEITDSELKY